MSRPTAAVFASSVGLPPSLRSCRPLEGLSQRSHGVTPGWPPPNPAYVSASYITPLTRLPSEDSRRLRARLKGKQGYQHQNASDGLHRRQNFAEQSHTGQRGDQRFQIHDQRRAKLTDAGDGDENQQNR